MSISSRLDVKGWVLSPRGFRQTSPRRTQNSSVAPIRASRKEPKQDEVSGVTRRCSGKGSSLLCAAVSKRALDQCFPFCPVYSSVGNAAGKSSPCCRQIEYPAVIQKKQKAESYHPTLASEPSPSRRMDRSAPTDTDTTLHRVAATTTLRSSEVLGRATPLAQPAQPVTHTMISSAMLGGGL